MSRFLVFISCFTTFMLALLLVLTKAFAYNPDCFVKTEAGTTTEFKFYSIEDIKSCEKNATCEARTFILEHKSELYKRNNPDTGELMGFVVPYEVNIAVSNLIDDAECE